MSLERRFSLVGSREVARDIVEGFLQDCRNATSHNLRAEKDKSLTPEIVHSSICLQGIEERYLAAIKKLLEEYCLKKRIEIIDFNGSEYAVDLNYYLEKMFIESEQEDENSPLIWGAHNELSGP